MYWYYQYKNNEINKTIYRDKIIQFCLEHYDTANKLLLIELYRRAGLFDKALLVIKTIKQSNEEKYYGFSVKNIIKQQRRLCKEENNERKIMRIKSTTPSKSDN